MSVKFSIDLIYHMLNFTMKKKIFGKVAIVTQPVAAGQYKLHI